MAICQQHAGLPANNSLIKEQEHEDTSDEGENRKIGAFGNMKGRQSQEVGRRSELASDQQQLSMNYRNSEDSL